MVISVSGIGFAGVAVVAVVVALDGHEVAEPLREGVAMESVHAGRSLPFGGGEVAEAVAERVPVEAVAVRHDSLPPEQDERRPRVRPPTLTLIMMSYLAVLKSPKPEEKVSP